MDLNKNYYSDKDFLKRLDDENQKEVFVKLISLTKEELPVEEIQGKATGGSISIDGASSVRRTCSITLVSQDININNYYWGLTHKFKVEVGLTNRIEPNYPDIIWFPQGVFVITSFQETVQGNSHTISISGKDKMCLLNGDVGGNISSLTWNFNKVDEYDEHGNKTTKDLLIKDIIYLAVSEYAQEPMNNIVINDLNETGLLATKYTGETPLYFWLNSNTKQCEQIYLGDSQMNYYYKTTENEWVKGNEDNIVDGSIKFESMVDVADNIFYNNPTLVGYDLNQYGVPDETFTIAKLEPETNIGYRLTDLTYAGDLILNVGETITSLLDKIIQQLGNYEYYYDVYGHFIFQRKRTYLNQAFNSLIEEDGEYYAQSQAESSAVIYNFEGNHLISSFNNSPDYNNIKNDYTIWGTRKTVSGAEIPVHLRYAIDRKPLFYKTCSGDLFVTNDFSNELIESEKLSYEKEYIRFKNQLTNSELTEEEINSLLELKKNELNGKIHYVDWREIIYQMALDYRTNFFKLNNFLELVQENNGKDEYGNWYYPYGKTNYEQYYTDLEGFWRSLYCYDNSFYPQDLAEQDFNNSKKDTNYFMVYDNTNYNKPIYIDIKCDVQELNDNYIYIYEFDNVFNNWFIYKYDIEKNIKSQIIKMKNHQLDHTELVGTVYKAYVNTSGNDVPAYTEPHYYVRLANGYKEIKLDYNINETYYQQYSAETESDIYDANGWNKDIINAPETLLFWFDFLDNYSDLSKYAVYTIGDRTKSLKDDKVTAIYFRTTPGVILYNNQDYEASELKDLGYTYIQCPENFDALFDIAASGKSAMDVLNDLLYKHSYCSENVTITAVPVYYLEPNTRVFIYDDTSGINGEYILNKITLPLTYNGMINITANKAPERIY